MSNCDGRRRCRRRRSRINRKWSPPSVVLLILLFRPTARWCHRRRASPTLVYRSRLKSRSSFFQMMPRLHAEYGAADIPRPTPLGLRPASFWSSGRSVTSRFRLQIGLMDGWMVGWSLVGWLDDGSSQIVEGNYLTGVELRKKRREGDDGDANKVRRRCSIYFCRWKLEERERERRVEDRCAALLSLQTTPTKRKETGERGRDAGEGERGREEERNICHSGMDGRC